MEGIKVRPLQVKDVFTVARMLGKITKGARQEIANALSDKKDETNPVEFALVLFQSILTEAEEDLKTWLADLISKKVEDFEVMPATSVIDIIEELVTQEGTRDFFARASRLANKLPNSPKSPT